MRFLSIIVLILFSVLEISPIPITPLILIWIVIFRPAWFYRWVMRIYN